MCILFEVKRYGQRCAVARALDVIGERWTPLIVRELLLGPKRYTDLIEGLPGIGTNVLATRLSDLQAHGIIEKHVLPPPAPATVYELTDSGRALAPVLRELRTWGSRYGPAPEPGDVARSAWVLQSAVSRPPGLKSGRTCEIRVGPERFRLTGENATTTVRAGSAASADAIITIEPSVLFRLAAGKLDALDAAASARIEGDSGVADDVFAMLAGSAQAPSAGEMQKAPR
jgi:DNA-binding HxlR family transcriptional regulator